MLGSTTQKVVRHTNIPVMAVKEKGSGLEVVNEILKELDELRSVII